jgi:hypothetical protein
MALQTQGYSLSALPRSPNVPANIGVVDVKEIYDGVRQGLAAFEQVRRAPQSMLLADAEMKAKTLEAPLGTQILAEQATQAPIKTSLLASEASPEMQAAKRKALENRSLRSPSGDIQLANALADAERRLLDDPNDQDAASLVAVLRPMALRKSAVSAANPQGVIDAGVAKTADTNATRTAVLEADRLSREAEAEKNRVARAQQETERNNLRRELDTAKQEASKAIAEARIAAILAGRPDQMLASLHTAANEAESAGDTRLEKYYRDAAVKLSKPKEEKDDIGRLLSAIQMRGQGTPTATPAPAPKPAATPATTDWKEVTLPNGTKVRVKKTP